MHDGAFTGVSLIDNVGNASDIEGNCVQHCWFHDEHDQESKCER